MMNAARSAAVIGAATMLEAIRNRLLLVSLFFGLVLVALSVAAASVAIGARARLIVDIGLAAASGLGSLVAIALTISSFSSEIKNRTVYALLVRPLPRWSFVLGKYLGVVGAMSAVVTLMLLATAATVYTTFGDWSYTAFWGSMWLACLEMALVCSIAMLFSTMSTPVIAACFSAGLVVAGNLADDISMLAQRAYDQGANGAGAVLEGIYYLIPDLGALSLRTQAANMLPIPEGYLLSATGYAAAYSAAVLILSMWLFSRRKVI